MSPAKPGALPTYLRIAEKLTIDIRTGRLLPGKRLPPEREFAQSFGVTVTTLRKSLKILTERGLLERRQGSGNYVLGGRTDLGTYALFRLELITGGGLPTADLLSLTRRAPPPDHPFHAASAPLAWNIRRRRALDGQPVAVEDIWLSGQFSGDLRPETLSESLYHTYKAAFGLIIARAEDRVGVGRLPDWAKGDVNFQVTRELGLVRRRAFDGYGALAEVSTTWFDPRRAAYVARIP